MKTCGHCWCGRDAWVSCAAPADGSAQGIDEHTLLLTGLVDDAASAAREPAGLRGCGPAVIIAWGLDYQAVREPRGIQRPADSLSP
jgi:hypothetical protein